MENLKLLIDNNEYDLLEDSIGLAIDYALEDEEDFSKKKSTEALSVKVPGTAKNISFENDLIDFRAESLDRHSDYKISYNALTLMRGKAFLREVESVSDKKSLIYDLYSNNADWIIANQTTTFHDLLKDVSFDRTSSNIENSFNYDGRTSGNNIYVFAPVRYAIPLKDSGGVKDMSFDYNYLKPSISVYYLIKKAFTISGYRIESTFLDTDFFRRLVMPWTWGAFNDSQGSSFDLMKVVAKTPSPVNISNIQSYEGRIDANVTQELSDPQNCYSYDAINKRMVWTCNSSNPSMVFSAKFEMELSFNRKNGQLYIWSKWYVNGNLILDDPIYMGYNYSGNRYGVVTSKFNTSLFSSINGIRQGDTVSCEIYVRSYSGVFNKIDDNYEVLRFETTELFQTIGSRVDFSELACLKNYKFLDLLRGIIDCFNLSIQTDNVLKKVVIEPTHDYSITQSNLIGYFDGVKKMDEAFDISKISRFYNYFNTNRQQIFKYKDDSNDGFVNILEEKTGVSLGKSIYVLPERFSDDGDKVNENRFFSKVIHLKLSQYGNNTYCVAIVPDNISKSAALNEDIKNSSVLSDVDKSTFIPKLCYYEGKINSRWYLENTQRWDYPYMYAVDYSDYGHSGKPNLSYSDEKVGGYISPGLLSRYYMQRMANMRNGQMLEAYFKIRLEDVLDPVKRKLISLQGINWELLSISGYDPSSQETVKCLLRKKVAISNLDIINTYPTRIAINSVENKTSDDVNDIPYAKSIVRVEDIEANQNYFKNKPL